MVSIRRKLGAFAVAMTIAAGMVLMPAPVHAKSKTSTLDGFCGQLLTAIAYVRSIESNLATDLLLAQLEATYTAYCGTLPE